MAPHSALSSSQHYPCRKGKGTRGRGAVIYVSLDWITKAFGINIPAVVSIRDGYVFMNRMVNYEIFVFLSNWRLLSLIFVLPMVSLNEIFTTSKLVIIWIRGLANLIRSYVRNPSYRRKNHVLCVSLCWRPASYEKENVNLVVKECQGFSVFLQLYYQSCPFITKRRIIEFAKSIG